MDSEKDIQEAQLTKDFPMLKLSLAKTSLGNVPGLRDLLGDFAAKIKAEIQEESSAWYCEESVLPEIFGVLLTRIRMDSKYWPKLNLENMATLSIDSRKKIRSHNR